MSKPQRARKAGPPGEDPRALFACPDPGCDLFNRPIKEVLGYPLCGDFRSLLSGGS